MKYIAIVDDEFLSNFRLDDGGLTLVMLDKTMATRAVKLFPIHRNTFTTVDGKSVYLTQGHVDALIEYERDEGIKNYLKRLSDHWGTSNGC